MRGRDKLLLLFVSATGALQLGSFQSTRGVRAPCTRADGAYSGPSMADLAANAIDRFVGMLSDPHASPPPQSLIDLKAAVRPFGANHTLQYLSLSL